MTLSNESDKFFCTGANTMKICNSFEDIIFFLWFYWFFSAYISENSKEEKKFRLRYMQKKIHRNQSKHFFKLSKTQKLKINIFQTKKLENCFAYFSEHCASFVTENWIWPLLEGEPFSRKWPKWYKRCVQYFECWLVLYAYCVVYCGILLALCSVEVHFHPLRNASGSLRLNCK